MTILGIELADHEAEIFSMLGNGWVATHTVNREFRINNGPSEDMAMIHKFLEAGLVVRASERAYIAAFCPWPYRDH